MEIQDHLPSEELGAFVAGLCHVHGIIVISGNNLEATHAPTLPGPKPESVAAIVGSYKSAVSRRINTVRRTSRAPVWQSNYYEHVVRNERALDRIRRYIMNNPACWAEDAENLERAMGESDEKWGMNQASSPW